MSELVIHALVCLHNGFAKLPSSMLASLWWWAIVSGGIGAVVALYGTYHGMVAGYLDLPVFMAVRVGVGRLALRRPKHKLPGVSIGLIGDATEWIATTATLLLAISLFWAATFVAAHITVMALFVRLASPAHNVNDAWTWGIGIASIMTLAVVALLIRVWRGTRGEITASLEDIRSRAMTSISFLLGFGMLWILASYAIGVLATFVLFFLDDPGRPLDDAWWWGRAVTSVITPLVIIPTFASILTKRRRERRCRQAPPSDGSTRSSPASAIVRPSSSEFPPTTTPTRLPTLEPELAEAGAAIRSHRLFIAARDVLVLTPEGATDGASVNLGLGLKPAADPWSRVKVWAVVTVIVLVASGIYANSIIEDPPHTVGALVEFVGVESGGYSDIIDRYSNLIYPRTVPVYQVPAGLTHPMDDIEWDPLKLNGLELQSGPSIESLSRALLDPDQIAEINRLSKELGGGLELQSGPSIESLSRAILDLDRIAEINRPRTESEKARELHETRRKLLRGPSGVVFCRLSAGKQIVDGVVVKGSRGIVVADDQGGRGNRAVLVRLLRDPGLGADPGVVVVGRAADLRVLPEAIRPPRPDGHDQEEHP